jgi:hypothetical protein
MPATQAEHEGDGLGPMSQPAAEAPPGAERDGSEAAIDDGDVGCISRVKQR